MESLLRVLDHPQAPDIIQRMINSRPRQTTALEQVCESPITVAARGMCSHCCAMADILTTGPPVVDHTHPPMAWTLATLHRIVHLGSVRESGEDGADFLCGLSNTALCNLLVLLEQNARTLCKDTLARFLGNVKGLESVKRDEWCVFLIQRLYRRHVCSTDVQQSVGRQEEQSRPEVLDTETLDTEAGGREEDWESSDSEDSSILPSPGSDVKADIVSAGEGTDDKHLTPQKDYSGLMTEVYLEWSKSKSADQENFNLLWSQSNESFLKSLQCFNGHPLPETSLSAISANISSLPAEMSYHNAVTFIRAVIFPMVVELKQNASRPTVSGLCLIGSLYPIPMVHGFAVPLLQHPSFGASHGNLLGKVLEESATREQLDGIWECLTGIEVSSNGGPNSHEICGYLVCIYRKQEPFLWTEDICSVALTLFKKRITVTEASVGKLIGTLQRNATALCKSSKFAKLVVEMCKSSRYQPLVSRFQTELVEIASIHKSILKSAMTREIRKLTS